jgi:hypothetical protein
VLDALDGFSEVDVLKVFSRNIAVRGHSFAGRDRITGRITRRALSANVADQSSFLEGFLPEPGGEL